VRTLIPILVLSFALSRSLCAADAPPTITAITSNTAYAQNTAKVLKVTASDDGGEANLLYTWDVVSGPGAVTFEGNTTNAAKNTMGYFTKSGNYVVRCTACDGSGLIAVATTATTLTAVLTTITVSPQAQNLLANASRQFSAAGLDQFNHPMSPQPAFTWSATGGTITTAGLYKAGSALVTGTARATVGSKYTQATIYVVSSAAPSIATPIAAAANPVMGKTVALSVLGADDGGEAALTYSWANLSSTTGTASFSPNTTNLSKNTVATFSAIGDYELRVAVNDAQGNRAETRITLTVEAVATGGITISPTVAYAPPRGTRAFLATAIDQFNVPITAFAWSITGGGTIDQGGVVSAGANAGGPWTVKAQKGTVSATATFTVYGTSQALLAYSFPRASNPERMSPLVLPPAFDLAKFQVNQAGYLATPEPGRVWQPAQPGSGVPILSAPLGTRQHVASGVSVQLRAQGAANAPITFTSLDGGNFSNSIASATVMSDASGIATAQFTPPPRYGPMRILAASPMASGQVVFRVSVE
jgi:hypothetical protein